MHPGWVLVKTKIIFCCPFCFEECPNIRGKCRPRLFQKILTLLDYSWTKIDLISGVKSPSAQITCQQLTSRFNIIMLEVGTGFLSFEERPGYLMSGAWL